MTSQCKTYIFGDGQKTRQHKCRILVELERLQINFLSTESLHMTALCCQIQARCGNAKQLKGVSALMGLWRLFVVVVVLISFKQI